MNSVLKGKIIEHLTDDEFFQFCQENSDFKFERNSNGQLLIMSPTGFNTGKRNIAILEQLNAWNRAHKLGVAVDSDTGFYLPNGAMRNPDAAWISHERLEKIDPEELDRFPHACPDFIVELKSKHDSLKELKLKMIEWIENGCRLGWLIDPDEQRVYVYRPKAHEQIISFREQLSGDPELPGFVLDVRELR
jgi:Uma2 family endonuclease